MTVASPQSKSIQRNVHKARVRLDRYVAEALPQFSRAYLQKLIEQGSILVNGQKAKASQRLSRGDRIVIIVPPAPTHPLAEPSPLSIIYEDKDILVIDKPAGLVVHPSPGHPSHTLVNAILAHCPSLAASDDLIRPGIVHRLDKDTSGLIVIAKNDRVRQYLINQFKRHAITKGYLVLVKGKLPYEQGIIEAPIGRNPYHRKRMAVVGTGKAASTQYKVKKYLDNYSLLDITPLTGRTHQIRVHMSYLGYPVLGDHTYGVKSPYLRRQFLHAYRLGFRLPSTDDYQEFTCPLPPDLERALELLAQNTPGLA